MIGVQPEDCCRRVHRVHPSPAGPAFAYLKSSGKIVNRQEVAFYRILDDFSSLTRPERFTSSLALHPETH